MKHNKGQSIVELVLAGAGAIGLSLGFVYTAWISPLQTNSYQENGTIQALSSSVGDIKDTLAETKQEVDFLAQQRGYVALSTTTYAK